MSVVPARTVEEVVRRRRHGDVYLTLKAALSLEGAEVYKLVHDLGLETDAVVRRRDGSLALIEIKTGGAIAQVHTGVGQLNIYRQLMEGLAEAELWLMLPSSISADLAGALRRAGIGLISYGLSEADGEVVVEIPDRTIEALGVRR